jgi:hypothetical protein
VAGALTVAAARFEGTDLLVPVFVGAVRPDRYTVEPVGGSLRPGMPIYALDGGALAIAGAGGSSAHPVADALARLGSLAGQDPSLPRTIGVCFQAITPALAAFVGEGGVLVSVVQEDGPAGRAGVLPGDVVTRIAEVPTPTLEEARRQIASSPSGRTVAVTVRRAGRPRELEVAVEETLGRESCVGAQQAAPAAPLARTLLTDSALSGAGLSPDAVVVAVDGVPAGQRSAQAALRRQKGAHLLHVQEGEDRFFAVVGSSE